MTLIKVLLIDDDPEEFELFCMSLENYDRRISCKHVTSCDNIEDTLQKEEPHIIFLDFNMPGVNGYECLKNIKNNPAAKDISVYMFSASEIGYLYKDKCLEAGAKGWISKPKRIEGYIKVFERVFGESTAA